MKRSESRKPQQQETIELYTTKLQAIVWGVFLGWQICENCPANTSLGGNCNSWIEPSVKILGDKRSSMVVIQKAVTPSDFEGENVECVLRDKIIRSSI